MRDLPPPGAGPGAERVRAPLLDLLPLHLQAERLEELDHEARRRLLVAGEARHADQPGRGLDEPVAVDLHPRKCGSTCSPKSRICSCRFCAPELEHHVGAAGVAVLLDRLDAVGRRARDRAALVEERVRDLGLRREPPALLHRLGHGPDLVLLDPGEVEQRVGGALDVLHLVREVHAGDLARAVAAGVAVGLVDRGDDRAADVDLAADVLARVADERRRRDRRREAAVGDLARELLHLRRGRRDVDRRHLARRVRVGRQRRHVGAPRVAVVVEPLAARGRRARSSPRRASARASSSSASSCC